jgi:hypothetical protein
VIVAVLVVVTHLGFLAWSGGTGILYGLFGDLHVLVVDGARSRWVDSRTRDVNLLPVRRDKLLAVDGDVVHDSASLVGGTVGRGIDGGASYVDLLAIVRLDPGAVLALSNVNGGAVGAVLSVNLNARFGVGRLRSAMLFTVGELCVGAGTAVMFLFTSDADLFFSEATLSTWRKMCLGLERRVLTFPSGVLGELDL